MKRYVKKEQEETTSELSDWVGVVLIDGCKGAILYIGDCSYHIICNNIGMNKNCCCGGRNDDGNSIKDVIDKWASNGASIKFKYIYCFDSFKELMQWFTDGIK